MNLIAGTVGTHLGNVVKKFGQSRPFAETLGRLKTGSGEPIPVSGLAGSAPAILLANLQKSIPPPIVAVLSDADTAINLYDDLHFLLGEEKIAYFPPLGIPPYDFRSPAAEVTGQRLATLAKMRDGDFRIIIAPIEALIEPTISLAEFEAGRLSLQVGDEIDIEALVSKLSHLGFRRVPLVEEIGDFALRGGLIDFFSPGFDYPIRVEFFGDTIETIRQFDVATQRSERKLDKISLLPRREVGVTEETIEKYMERIPEKDADLIRARFRNDPELPGLEWLAISLGITPGSFIDFMPPEVLFYADSLPSLEVAIRSTLDDARRHYDRIRNRLENPPSVETLYCRNQAVVEKIRSSGRIEVLPFKGARTDIIDFQCREHPSIGSRLDLLGQTINGYLNENINFIIAADNAGQAARLGELLSEKIGITAPIPIEVALLKGGFICWEGKLAILTDHQIFGRYFRRTRRKRFKEGVALQNYTSLAVGDYVVHADYGIARYAGLKTIMLDSRPRDCLHLVYANKDKLYVPIEEFNRVGKYSGKDSAPKLSSLGGAGWEKIKARAKKAIEDMAADLIKLYAERKARPGFAFGPDTVWMKQLEASFIYEETPDQLKAIETIKADMEKPTPMDRLVCGDVGYGKTEVGVRAAFKAVESGKQAAVLVPTTILAQQHLATFTQRLRDFPVKIEMLSRFRSRKEQLEIVKALGEGKIDVIIGTHRLLSKDVKFADLGLLIIDEEQRFGVKHKETLRKLKATVDTIALTATPIPRTLHMSLTGARDMSLINTSPKDRLPIVTEICEFEPGIIQEAILREVDRGGQVFFVHNRVQTIEAMRRYLKKIVPQVEIAVAHGQMHERSLEGIMLAFLSGRFQVLLSTSIIESGLDIPSVNTIIINRADRFGLAQLYQLRGRVGRSAARARAYLLTPPYRLLSEDARKRLRAIEAHADLGSGFALAMKDLEIRGAGNILGAEQSGFIEEVGFDLYTRMLEEAVAEIRGEKVIGLPDTKLETDIELMIPNSYINISQQKVEIYQKIAGARSLQEIENIREDVEDRFGRPPDIVNNLFDAAAARITAFALEIEKVRIKNARVELIFKEGRKFDRKEIEGWRRAVAAPLEFALGEQSVIRIDLSPVNEKERIAYLKAALNRI
jgi:transcription-repair coupling factor (superfamily II helicase)